jgi:UDP-2,3-diacylglucosamine pyrophosphatase LpxH
MTNQPTDQQLDLDAIEAKAAELRQKIDRKNPWPSDNESFWTAEGWKSGTRNALDKLHVEPLLAEVRRLRAENAELTEARRLEWAMQQAITPHTPRICVCGHSHHAHTVPAPHSCLAHGQTCQCPAYRQMRHEDALAHQERKQAEHTAARPSV